MTVKSYDRQHLAVFAAGYINAAGTSQVNFGCQMTRISTGHYGLLLDADNSLIDDETFTFVTPKSSDPRYTSVVDTADNFKRILTATSLPSEVDTGIEVVLYRPVSK